MNLSFREGDARKLPYPPDRFNVVLILGNSFGYFEDAQEDAAVLKEVCRVLRPSGRLLMDIADGEYLRSHYEPRSWEWIDDKLFVCRERTLSAQGERLISREVITHVERGVLADQIYAERLYTREDMEQFLQAFGFCDVAVTSTQTSVSSQYQDFGMMARRILVAGSIRKEWTAVRRRTRKDFVNVAVILGDPYKPDPVKPQNSFDKDDFETIDRLKSALASLPGRHFFYLNRHNKLIQELLSRRMKIDYVFNLCDEGYGNDPRKELHVPALLDMLGISYSGSGPQCLAFCYDKSLVRGIAGEMGIPVGSAFFVRPDAETIDSSVAFPVIVKPNFGDSSFGIFADSVAEDEGALLDAIRRLHGQVGYEKPVLVEEFLPGKDLTIGIIGNPSGPYQVLPITEEDYSELPPELPRICGYEAKWCPDSPYWKIRTVPATLPKAVEEAIAEWSLRLAQRLECRD